MSNRQTWPGVVEDVRRALAPKGRAQLQRFAVEGARLVQRAVRAGCAPSTLIVSERALRQRDERLAELLGELERVGCAIVAVPDGVVLELAEGRGSSVFGLCEYPEPLSLQQVTQADQARAPLLVLADVEEPGNVGALVRTALAAGASGLVAVGVSDPFHPKAVRTSMGSLFKLPIVRVPTADAVLEILGPQRCAATVSDGGVPPWQAQLRDAAAIFVGREADGIPERVTQVVGQRVSIPMPTGVDSYSVNAAAAIVLYEARRQTLV